MYTLDGAPWNDFARDLLIENILAALNAISTAQITSFSSSWGIETVVGPGLQPILDFPVT